MGKLINIQRYTRKIGHKVYPVRTHRRKIRKLGRKIRFKRVGTFRVGMDNYGNLRGSKIIGLH